MSAGSVPASQLWLIALGFCVWCSALVLSYALHSIGCAFAWSPGILRLSLSLTIIAHLAVIGWLWRRCSRTVPDPALREVGSFVHWVIIGTLISAFVTVVFTLGPALLMTTCA
jgi:hypothetical protein